jgi:hypothetical protein
MIPRRSRSTSTAPALVIVALLVIAGLSCLVAVRAEAAERTVCMEAPGVEGCVVRPHAMGYGAHASIYGIHWRSWGGYRAVGVGHILWRRTVTEPHFGPYRAKLVLTEPGECGRKTWYSRRSLTIKQGDVLEREEPFGPCNAL